MRKKVKGSGKTEGDLLLRGERNLTGRAQTLKGRGGKTKKTKGRIRLVGRTFWGSYKQKNATASDSLQQEKKKKKPIKEKGEGREENTR